jgi:hypothetical protein
MSKNKIFDIQNYKGIIDSTFGTFQILMLTRCKPPRGVSGNFLKG